MSSNHHHHAAINVRDRERHEPTLGPLVDRSRSASSASSSGVNGAIPEGGRRRHRSRSRSSSRSTRIANEEPHQPHARNTRERKLSETDAEPLLVTDAEMIPKEHPPIAHPETSDDDLDAPRLPNTPEVHPGVDGGFFTGDDDDDIFSRGPDIGPRLGDDADDGATELDGIDPAHRVGKSPVPRPRPSFPRSPGIETEFTGMPIVPDVNVYQQKKTLAQGMMDLALLSANANQLRYVLESYNNHPYYHVSLVFIAMSIILQIAVGVGLIWNSRYNVKNQEDICKADRINNFTVMGIFMITTVNVFITSFGVAQRDGGPNAVG